MPVIKLSGDDGARLALEASSGALEGGDESLALREGLDVLDAGLDLGQHGAGANWPWAMYSRASATVIVDSSSWSGLLKLMQTFSTAVRMTSMSAPKSAASLAEERSLSMTAGTPS